jgi:acetyl-CoA carboxylase biotin carboxyl carrier protein
MMKRAKRQARAMTEDFTDPAVMQQIAVWLENAGASAIEIETEDGRHVRIVMDEDTSLHADDRPRETVPMAHASVTAAKAPFAGHFLDAHPARATPAAAQDTAGAAGDIVGFVKVGPLLMPVRTPVAGTLNECLVKAGDLVGYRDPIFLIEPAQ